MKQTPLQLKGINDNIYAGFGPRLGSLLLDLIFVLPVTFAILYVNSFGKNYFFITLIPSFLFNLYYHVYLPRHTGGTPGKNIMGIKIIRLDGKPIGWREAFLRYAVLMAISLAGIVIMSISIAAADDSVFVKLSWLQQSVYLMSLSPVLFTVFNWINNIWVWGELVVLLTNSRKRAVHDYIAGTVIVKSIYIGRINEEMYGEETEGLAIG